MPYFAKRFGIFCTFRPGSMDSKIALNLSFARVCSLALRYLALVLYIQRPWTPKHPSVDPRLGTTALGHNRLS